jgi:hypothetical protein
MSLSFNEIEAIALKSIRGAGASWGLAEEAAFAARWLAERGFDWAGALLARCETAVGEDMTADENGISGERLCALRVGAFLAEAGLPSAGLLLRDVAAPLLLLPFIARGALETPIAIRIDGAAPLWLNEARLYGEGGGFTCPSVAAVAVTPAGLPGGVTVVPQLSRPSPVAPGALQRLAAFERRTYVPATAQSRLAGAGAGLSDND